MNGKKAKILRKLAKAVAEDQGLTDVGYKTIEHPRMIPERNRTTGKLEQKVVKKATIVLGNCERMRSQRFKRTYKKLRETPRSPAEQREMFIKANAAPKIVEAPAEAPATSEA